MTRRILIEQDPYLNSAAQRGAWPCWWIGCPDVTVPFVGTFRRVFQVEDAVTIRLHVSADERYELFLDGERIGRGPERGDANNCFFESYEVALEPGQHVLVARVWALGEVAPLAQMSVRPGFLLSPESEELIALLGTGIAFWEAKPLSGVQFTEFKPAFGSGANLDVEGALFDWDFERGAGENWLPAPVLHPASNATRNEFEPLHLLRPAISPPMLENEVRLGRVRFVADLPLSKTLETHSLPIRAADNLPPEIASWQALVDGAALLIPPHTRRRVLVDLENYLCAYPEIITSGGAGSEVRLHWQESLYEEITAQNKGNRDEIEGKYFACIWWPHDGLGDLFRPDGGQNRRFNSLWWHCGRYLEIVVQTGDEPLEIEKFTLRETRYPLENEGSFACDDARLEKVNTLSLRTLQVCLHETFFDCPYYEQLNYVGDTRVELLTSYVFTRDERPARKALQLFAASLLPSGLTQSRYPSRVRNVIPPYALWWIGMLFDFALWRGDPAFVKSLMPGVRAVVDGYRRFLNADGLIEAPEGWNNFDWVPDWPGGVPPQAEKGVSAVLHWQFVLALKWVAELETWLEEPELAARAQRFATELSTRAEAHFWDEKRGVFADELNHEHFSQHTQCLALLSGQLYPHRAAQVGRGLLENPALSRAQLYFSHYLFETLAQSGRGDIILEKLVPWYALEAQGFKTTPEMAEPSRSDCHAWSAHPAYHCFASLLGIRPAAMGFARVAIAPQLGVLNWVRGVLPHPRGEIEVALRREKGVLRGHVALPQGVSGHFVWEEQSLLLRSGRQSIALDD